MNKLPHGGAVEVHQEPLGRVEGQAVSVLDAGHPCPELRADEGRPGVSCIHVKPHILIFAWKFILYYVSVIIIRQKSDYND
jgi:hypothetical protein